MNLEDAYELRAALIAEVRQPLEQALSHSDRLGGADQLDAVRDLHLEVTTLEALAELTEGDDLRELITDASRQSEISRRFRTLQKRANEVVAEQRDTVAAAGRIAEQRALIVTLAAAVLSLIATLAVVLTLRPLRRLAISVRRIGAGEWRERLELGERPERDDEVARLSREVNHMAEALEERERRLLHGERLAAIGRLAAQITHEIRNPLSSVALNAELLEDELGQFGEDSEEARQLLSRIATEVDRLTQITEAYLGFARRPKPQLARLELGRQLTDLLDFLAQEHRQNGVLVVRELPSEPLWVEADAGQLRQALINLLRNAQEAALEVNEDEDEQARRDSGVGDLLDDLDELDELEGEPARGSGADQGPERGRGGARIVVTLEPAGEGEERRANIRVADSGPGIPGADEGGLERIFEAFVTSKAHGTGLGLPMVQQIAVDHGGGVRLLETGPEGTRFELWLPACDPPAPSVSSPNFA
nr:HAMP domain-containing sensor histidine kinase [Pseudenhygromyxa sp. WMMC2535]